MTVLACGCESVSLPPYIRFCARHDPARVETLENLCHGILARAKGVVDGLDGRAGTFLPRIANVSAADAMEDLLEDFGPQFRKLMAVVPSPTEGTLR